MPRNTHAGILIGEEERQPARGGEASISSDLRSAGAEFAARVGWLPGATSSSTFLDRSRRLRSAFKPIFAQIDAKFKHRPASDDLRWLRDNGSLIYAQMASLAIEGRSLIKLPHVRDKNDEIAPRARVLPEVFLELVDYQFNEQAFTSFCRGFQNMTTLDLRELWALVPGLKLALLEQIAARGRRAIQDPRGGDQGVGVCIRSLREVSQIQWKEVLEPLI